MEELHLQGKLTHYDSKTYWDITSRTEFPGGMRRDLRCLLIEYPNKRDDEDE